MGVCLCTNSTRRRVKFLSSIGSSERARQGCTRLVGMLITMRVSRFCEICRNLGRCLGLRGVCGRIFRQIQSEFEGNVALDISDLLTEWFLMSPCRIYAPLPSANTIAHSLTVQDATWDLGNWSVPYVEQFSNYFTKYTFSDSYGSHKVHGSFSDGTTSDDNSTFGAWMVMNTKGVLWREKIVRYLLMLILKTHALEDLRILTFSLTGLCTTIFASHNDSL